MSNNIIGKNTIKIFSKYIINFSLIILTSIISIYIANNTVQSGYEKLYLLPFIFGIVFVVFLVPILFESYKNVYLFVFLLTFTLFSFIRYVILPYFIVLTGFYGGLSPMSPSSESFNLALLLMIYELLVVAIVIFILFRRMIKKTRQREPINIEFPNNKFIYLLIIFISIVIVFLYPSILNSFYFITPTDEITVSNESTIKDIFTYIVFITKNIIYLILVTYLYSLYKKKRKKIYILGTFLVSLLNILIIFGTNRFDFLIIAVVTFVTFAKLYPKYAKIAAMLILTSVILITSLLTTYRDYQSYTGGTNELIDITSTMQVYTGGPYNVAIAIEAKKASIGKTERFNLIYEFLRPTLGFNFFLSGSDIQMSTDYFNERIFFSDNRSQIIPIIGQGYFYFGFLLAPIIMIMFLILAYFIVNKLYYYPRIELQYFLMIPVVRIGLGMGLNGVILMNIISYFLMLSLIVYYLNNKITLNKKIV